MTAVHVCRIVKKQNNVKDIQTIAKLLIDENIVSQLTNIMITYAKYPIIQTKCKLVLNQLLHSVNYDTSNNTNNTDNAITCDRFTTKNPIEKHQKTSIKSSNYTCKKCGKTYKYKCNFTSHLKIHTGDCHICSFCKKRFGRKSNYIQHLRVHTGEAPFPCKICHKRYKHRQGLKKHMKKHST
eukprot:170182_1